MCPLFKHKYEKEGGDPAPKMTELVDEWIALKREDWERYRRLEDLRALINAFCEEHGYRRLYGSDGAAVDRRPLRLTEPNAEGVRRILEPLGLWEQVGNRHGLAFAYDNLGQVYQKQGRTEEAMECLKKAVAILLEIGESKIVPELWQSGAWCRRKPT